MTSNISPRELEKEVLSILKETKALENEILKLTEKMTQDEVQELNIKLDSFRRHQKLNDQLKENTEPPNIKLDRHDVSLKSTTPFDECMVDKIIISEIQTSKSCETKSENINNETDNDGKINTVNQNRKSEDAVTKKHVNTEDNGEGDNSSKKDVIVNNNNKNINCNNNKNNNNSDNNKLKNNDIASETKSPENPINTSSKLAKSLSSQDLSSVKTFKIALIGTSGVGKTTFLNRYVGGDEWRNSDNMPSYPPTIGIDYKIKTIHFEEDSPTVANLQPKQNQNVSARLQLWDTAGQERFKALTKAYFRRCH
eukprot:Awhi_evm1s15059